MSDFFGNPQCLVLFSGGKDSFVTACRLVQQGYDVKLISFNNGAVAGEENLLHGVRRLQNRFGEDRVEYAGVYGTSSTVMRLTEKWAHATHEELGTSYPNLVNAQLTCLHCQTAMWIVAIAYASAKGIKAIASGYRRSDLFCTGLAPWTEAIAAVAKESGIDVMFPVWDTPEWDEYEGWERDNEMIRMSFVPQVLEPKCLLGRPVRPMTDAERSDMMLYFRENLRPVMDGQIKNLASIFKYLRLSERSLVVLHYDPPTGDDGIF